ncbi:hypothetical protein ACWGH2_29515 [Streptomyces sp. NPDC054871]
MSARNEYWLARDEIMRRGVEAGLDERELGVLLYAFEAGILRDYAKPFAENGEESAAGVLKAWAQGVRPRNWRALLPSMKRKTEPTVADTPADHSRRIYIDGEGEAWLSLSYESAVPHIGKVAGVFRGDTTDSVRERTGSLREIGRCL